jgi:hypothetical protein
MQTSIRLFSGFPRHSCRGLIEATEVGATLVVHLLQRPLGCPVAMGLGTTPADHSKFLLQVCRRGGTMPSKIFIRSTV